MLITYHSCLTFMWTGAHPKSYEIFPWECIKSTNDLERLVHQKIDSLVICNVVAISSVSIFICTIHMCDKTNTTYHLFDNYKFSGKIKNIWELPNFANERKILGWSADKTREKLFLIKKRKSFKKRYIIEGNDLLLSSTCMINISLSMLLHHRK